MVGFQWAPNRAQTMLAIIPLPPEHAQEPAYQQRNSAPQSDAGNLG